MNYEQIPEIIGQTINTLAEKLEVPTTQLLQIYGNGIVVEGIIGILISLLGAILATVIFYIISKITDKIDKKTDINNDEEEPYGILLIALSTFGIIVVVTSTASFFFGLQSNIIKIFTPDYYLLTEIFSKLG